MLGAEHTGKDKKERAVRIHVSHLKKNFGDLMVLKDISTDIYEGEVIGNIHDNPKLVEG